MRTGIIYKITNKMDGKVYIGQTLIDLNTRLRQHFFKAKQCRKSKLYTAMNTLSKECFEIELLEGDIPIKSLDSKEQFYIEKYNSIETGYNTTKGGDGRSTYSDINEQKIIELVNEGYTNIQIADIMKVSSATIQRLLLNKGIRRYDKIDDELLVELWHTETINNLAKLFDVNEKTIRRHAKQLGLTKR